MDGILRLLGITVGITLAGSGLSVMADTTVMTRLLALPQVQQLGLDNQLANIGFFLLAGGLVAAAGGIGRSPLLFYCAALLLGCVTGFRIFAAAAYGAPLSGRFILIELILLAALVWLGNRFQRQGNGVLRPTTGPG